MGFYANLKIAVSNIKMKKHLKTIISLSRHPKTSAAVVIALCLVIGVTPIVRADSSLQQQINTLNTQNSQAESSLSALQLQASSYQGAINNLQAQINAIQAAISANEAQETQLQQQITNDQSQLAEQKQLLGQDISAMYVNGQMSDLEMLATSKSLSDYVNAETYRGAVQDKIQGILTQIAQLENQLESQQTQLKQTLATQQSQQNQLTSDQNQQNQLLSMNQAQQATYNQQIQSNQSQISNLEAEQAAINNEYATAVHVGASPNVTAAVGTCDPPSINEGNGGYPAAWCDASFTMDYSPNDSNGFPERQCTSFAYWYFTSVEGHSLSVSGNAGQWWYTANQPVDQTPQVGAIGVEAEDAAPHYSPYGHVMIVLAVGGPTGTTYNGSLQYTSNASGTYVPAGDVLVMSMNEDEEGDFMYDLWPANTLYYIH